VIARRARSALAACVTVAVVAVAAAPWASSRDHAERSATEGPPTVTPDDIRFTNRTLRDGRPQQVELLPKYVGQLRDDAEAYLKPTPDHPRWPAYPGAVLLAAKDGRVVARAAVGRAVRYESVGPAPDRIGVELPDDQQIPTRRDTIFDVASMSKLFTTIVVLQLVEDGLVDLDAPVARYVPEFAAGGKEDVTVRMLLTHTSGLPPDPNPDLWAYPAPEDRLPSALATALDGTPGGQYVYSDIGFIALGTLVQRLTGLPLDEAVRRGVTGPLGMTDTGYNPPPELFPRIASTEWEPWVGRGMLRGEVHDENAWSLGGVSGHAGVFSTADDLAILCQTLLNGGQYGGVRILRKGSVRMALVNYNARFQSRYPDSDRGLGFQLSTYSYMGPLASPVTFGHTGYTGTSVVIDPLSHSFLLLLANRVHPDRNWGSNTVARAKLASDLAYAMPVRPLDDGTAWRADREKLGTFTLTAPLSDPVDDAAAEFQLWYDTDPRHDTVRFETSTDNGRTWSPTAMKLSWAGDRWTAAGEVVGYGGRHWWRVSANLPDGTTDMRWSYITRGTGPNVNAQGRGAYVDKIRVDDADVGRVDADGWTRASD
jgi:CubicO group peptidase (beta-lactamase class C family)